MSVATSARCSTSATTTWRAGINTLEELAYVKQMIIDVVRPDGWGVFNAEDPFYTTWCSAATGAVPSSPSIPKAPRFLQAVADEQVGAPSKTTG